MLWANFSSLIVQLLQILSNYFPRTILHSIVSLLPYVILGSICYGFDVIFLSVQDTFYLKAVVDNTAHGIIALVSWCIISEIKTRKDLIDAIVCGIIACGLDVDHFIAARSFKLQVRYCVMIQVILLLKSHKKGRYKMIKQANPLMAFETTIIPRLVSSNQEIF